MSKINAADIVKAASGDYHTLLLSKKGDVYAFGKNTFGQLGLGNNETDIIEPQQLRLNMKFKDI